MKTKNVLVAVDFSPSCERALEMASQLVRGTAARLLIVHVDGSDLPGNFGGGNIYAGLPADAARGQLLQMLKEVRPAEGVSYEHHLLAGDPAEAIVRFAESEEADLIILGTHGRTGLKRMLMGSVAEAVVRRATCPVLTLKSFPHAPGNEADEKDEADEVDEADAAAPESPAASS